MPSTISTSVSSALASSTVITPSLPTFCMASAIILPILVSPFEEMVPTWATSADEPTFFARFSMSFTTAETAMSMPRLRSIGFMPAATDFAPHLGAHVLELVLKLDLLRHRHPVLGDARCAEALVEHDVAALGAERHLHGVGKNVDAAQHLVARLAAKSYVFRSHFNLLHCV